MATVINIYPDTIVRVERTAESGKKAIVPIPDRTFDICYSVKVKTSGSANKIQGTVDSPEDIMKDDANWFDIGTNITNTAYAAPVALVDVNGYPMTITAFRIDAADKETSMVVLGKRI